MANAQRVLRIGTRGSELATTQAGHVRDALIAAGYPAELHIVRTEGDVNMAPVERIGVGVFTHALREALHRGECDVAVHSFKDLPTAPDGRFGRIVSPPRALPIDVLVSRNKVPLAQLPAGARVGTSAPRRRAQLAAVRPDLDLVPLRGNIETRMGFVASGELDAVVLAGAGLQRTGRLAEAAEELGPPLLLPAPAQGALAVEALVDDIFAAQALAHLADGATMVAVAAERQFLATLEAGCTAPVGALACVTSAGLQLDGVVAALDGSVVLREQASAEVEIAADGGVSGEGAVHEAAMAAARALGEAAARALLDRGAAAVVAGAEQSADPRAPLAPPAALAPTAPQHPPDGDRPSGDRPRGDGTTGQSPGGR